MTNIQEKQILLSKDMDIVVVLELHHSVIRREHRQTLGRVRVRTIVNY